MKIRIALIAAAAALCALAGSIADAQTPATKTIAAGQTTTTLAMTWTEATANADGSAFTGPITYNVYWGVGPCTAAPLTNRMNPAPLTSIGYTVTNVGPGLKCFAATAMENGGPETPQSPQFAITVLPAPVVVVVPTPKPPTNVTVK